MSDLVETGSPQTATSMTAIGTGGDGYLSVAPQSSAPATSTDLRIYANNSGHLGWRSASNQTAEITTATLTAPRTYIMPDSAGTLLTDSNTATISNKTAMSAAGNTLDATYISGQPVNGPFAPGTVLQNTGAVWAPLALSATTPLSYSAGNFSADVGTAANTLAAGNDPRFATPQVVRVKVSNPGAGEFTSIAAALASIVDSSLVKPYIVEIGPGVYTEPGPMTIPAYVTVGGAGLAATFVQKVPGIGALFSYSDYCSIRDMALIGNGSTTAINMDSAINAYATRIAITDFATPIYLAGSAGVCSATIVQLSITGTVTLGIYVDGRAITGTNTVTLGLNTAIINGTATTAIRVEGPYAAATLANIGLTGGTTGLLIQDSATTTTTSTRIQGYATGVSVANVGGAPTTYFDNVAILNCTADLTIAHPGATGSFSGLADNGKVTIATTSTFPFDFIDAANQSVTILGDLNYRPATGADTAEIGELITYSSALGTYTGGVISAGVGKTIGVTAGSGYLAHSVYPNQHLVNAIWPGYTSPTLADDTIYYVYADENGVATTLSLPNPITQILLGRVKTTTTGIEFIDSQRVSDYHPSNANLAVMRNAIGALYSTGSIVQTNGSRQVSISGGKYYYLNNEYNPAGQSSPANFFAYYHSAGVWTRAAATVVDNAQYDDNTNLVPIPAGQYVKHSFYIVGEGATEQYFFVYGQQTFASQAAAEAGNLPTPPPYFTEGIFRIAAFIVQQGVATVVSVLDLRPTLGSSAASFGAVTDHGNLTGLADDDHLQYLLVNGTRAMGGNLAMGGNAVSGATTYNGVVVETHASRHLPNGADPITTAAPLTTLSNATTNAIGTANSLARSDHTHAIDITTFPITSLSGTLTVAKGGTGATTLTAGRFLTGNGTGVVQTTVVVPTGTVVGTTDTQSLSNKTLTITTATANTNNIIARELWYGSGAGSISTYAAATPTAGQVLTATSGTTATWQAPGAALVDTSTFIVDAVDQTKRLGFDVTGTTNTTTTLQTTQTANQTTIIPNTAGGTDTFTLNSLAQTLANKTLTAPVISTISNGGTLTLPTGTDTIMARTSSDTMTNKTIIDATNNVAANSLKTSSPGVLVTLTGGAPPTAGQVLTATSGTAANWQTPGAALIDSTTFIVDQTNPTTRLGFDVTGTLGTTTVLQTTQTAARTITLPDATGTVTLLDATQNMSNKTFTATTMTANTNNVTARGLWHNSGAGSVSTYAAPAPTGAGQVLLTTSTTTAEWQTPGYVVGPIGATDEAIARYDGTTGKLIQNSAVRITDGGNIYGVAAISGGATGADPIITPVSVASAVNSLTVRNAITAAAPSIEATGTDATIPITLVAKNTLATNATVNITGTASSGVLAFSLIEGATGTITFEADPGGGSSVITVPPSTGTMLLDSNTIFVIGKSFDFASTYILNSGNDNRLYFSPGGSLSAYLTISTAQTTTRTLSIPNVGAGDSFVTNNTTATLVGKTLTSPIITNGGTLTLPTGPDTIVARTSTDTLTNKTLTAPVISTITNGGTLTLPTGTRTIVARDTTDVLSNKSLADATTFIVDDTDNTKRVGFTVAGTASRTLTLAFAQAFNATLNFPAITGTTDTVVTTTTTQLLSGKSLADATTFIVDDVDNTKRLNFALTSMSTGVTLTINLLQSTSQTLFLPNVGVSDTIVTNNTAASLTNKIIGVGNNVAANAINNGGTLTDIGTTPPVNGQALGFFGAASFLRWHTLNHYTYIATIGASAATPVTVISVTVPGTVNNGNFLVQASCVWRTDISAEVRFNLLNSSPATSTTMQRTNPVVANREESFDCRKIYTALTTPFTISLERVLAGGATIILTELVLTVTPIG